MKSPADTCSTKPPALKVLVLAIAANTLMAGYSHAGPTGGTVTDGDGSITQSGSQTQINQNSDRLSLNWDTFNIDAHERVQFVQPSNTATALNRILDNNGSRILGQIDANGHVILMNPNGIFFGQDATVNVGGLVASGLNINSADFMNGDLAFAAVAGTAGTVINRGIINAATGGNVALLGKSVANHGLISATLGHVALAAGSEAVVTFDDQGLIGVRIDKETLASEVGSSGAVSNTGTVDAKGGKILLNASVSADLFSKAVNHGSMGDGVSAVVHDDGSFTLGGGRSVVNNGTLDVSTDSTSVNDGGYVVLAGETINHNGTIRANAEGTNRAGRVYAEAAEVSLSQYSIIEANSDLSTSGIVSLEGDKLAASAGANISTSGNTLLSSWGEIDMPEISTNHLYLRSLDRVHQTGAVRADGNLHLALVLDGDAHLTHADNDFGSLSLDAHYATQAHINDRNDLILNDINIEDSSLRLELLDDGATLSQTGSTHLNISGSQVQFKADNIVLGEDGSTTTVNWYGFLDMHFTQHINTNSSVTLIDHYGLDNARIVGTDSYGDFDAIELSGITAIDLNATIDSNAYTMTVGNMVGNNATLQGVFETSQTGPIQLSGVLDWRSYIAKLNHPENDVATIQGTGALAFGSLEYVDKNNVIIGNIDTSQASENTVSITSVGNGSTLYQTPNSVINADFINLNADNIYLGANGRSRIQAGYMLEIDFGKKLSVNGPYSVGSYAPYLRITGNERNNHLVFGTYAISNSFAGDDLLATIDIDLGAGNDTAIFYSDLVIGNDEYFTTNRLDLGAGNDRLFLNRDVYIPVTLGTGKDFTRVWDNSTYYNLADFNSSEDTFVVHDGGVMR